MKCRHALADAEVTLLHNATVPRLRRGGVALGCLPAVRQSVPGGPPIVAETDGEALGFYVANGFDVTSLGEKYPGVDRFTVRQDVDDAVDNR
jgi:hypothetical protein